MLRLKKLLDHVTDGTPSGSAAPATPPTAADTQAEQIAKAVADGVAKAIAALQGDRKPVTANAAGLDTPAPTPGLEATEQKDDGKGWTVARYMRVQAKAHKDRIAPMEAAKFYAAGDRRYGEIVKSIGQAEEREKALNSGFLAQGGSLSQPTPVYQDYIDLLRPQVVVMSYGPLEVDMPAGKMDLGSVESDATASYVNETGTGPNASEPGTGAKQLVAKKLMVIVPIKNDWLRRSNAGADALIRNGIISRAGVRKDAAFLTGDGTQDTPKGIIAQALAANVFAQVGTDYAGIAGTLSKGRRLMKNANCPWIKPGWVFSPRTEEHLRTLVSTTGMFIYRDEMNQGKLDGLPFKTSTQMPDNLGAGANESKILLCDFSDVIVGKALDLQVDVFDSGAYKNSAGTVVSGLNADETVLRLIDEHDLVLMHPGCAAVATGITWGA